MDCISKQKWEGRWFIVQYSVDFNKFLKVFITALIVDVNKFLGYVFFLLWLCRKPFFLL